MKSQFLSLFINPETLSKDSIIIPLVKNKRASRRGFSMDKERPLKASLFRELKTILKIKTFKFSFKKSQKNLKKFYQKILIKKVTIKKRKKILLIRLQLHRALSSKSL